MTRVTRTTPMAGVTRRLVAILIAVSTATGLAGAQTPVDARFAPYAHSALVSVEAATLAPDSLTLRIRRTAGAAAVAPLQVAATVQGRDLPVTANTDGTWTVTLKDLRGKPPGELDLLISHDGIRELLTGTLTAPTAGTASASAAGLLRDHKQLAWWILNIAIVLIAAIAISRRMS
jgi:hypothetical protein